MHFFTHGPQFPLCSKEPEKSRGGISIAAAYQQGRVWKRHRGWQQDKGIMVKNGGIFRTFLKKQPEGSQINVA